MMKQARTLKTVMFQIAMLFVIAGCAAEKWVVEEPAEAEATASSAPTAVEQASSPEPAAPAEDTTSCATPISANMARCRQMEADILAVTARLELKISAPDGQGGYTLEDSSVGHGTIIEGRYLLTHNHFGLSLEDAQDSRRRTVTLYRPDGEAIITDAPFSSFEVVSAGPETLLFDFGDFGGVGLFAALGLPSAQVESGAALQSGMEVAQVDWDGRTAHVDWVRVRAVTDVEGSRTLVLDNFVERGASGGGVFYEGDHVANNWNRQTELTAGGEVLDQYTLAAVNE
jgi:hypothetical protein